MNSVWACVYKHDQRKHRHRCRACQKTINEGETVLMCRFKRGTRAVHETCADTSTGITETYTWRDAFRDWTTPPKTYISQAI